MDQNAIIEKEIDVSPSTEGVKVMSLAHEDGYILGTENIAIAINGSHSKHPTMI